MILLIDNYDSFSFNLVQMIGEIACDSAGERIEKSEIFQSQVCAAPKLEPLAAPKAAAWRLKDELRVIRNDELGVDEIMALAPSHIVISPGPGRPQDAGVCEALIKAALGKIPLLGVCLGHQAICEALGGKITYAPELMHGKQSMVAVDNESLIFKGLPREIRVARYHSLVADKDMIPDCLEVTAVDEKGEVMAVQHKTAQLYGLQFHPESIMTADGKKMAQNFLGGKI